MVGQGQKNNDERRKSMPTVVVEFTVEELENIMEVLDIAGANEIGDMELSAMTQDRISAALYM